MGEVLTLRQLNRATLARQMLLERCDASPPAAIEQLGGMQAQAVSAPFIGLWSRLNGASRESLIDLIATRAVVRATFLRGTLHLVTAADYLRFRAALQPMLVSSWMAIVKDRAPADLAGVLRAAKEFLAAAPRTFEEISEMLANRWPENDIGAMRYAVRMHLPLIQIPTASAWSFPGQPRFGLAEEVLGRPIGDADRTQDLVRRYLGAFGPATVRDMQTWCGLENLTEAFEALRSHLRVYRDENRRELFDLPDAPHPHDSTAAPPRFLPEYDNLLHSHSVRRRVLADEHRKRVFLPGIRVRAAILIDGFVGGVWEMRRKGGTAVLAIEPFAPLAGADSVALEEEGSRLARFIEPDAKAHDVRFLSPA